MVQVAPGASDKILVIVTDDEWDFGNLKLCPEILRKKLSVDNERKREYITKFAQSVFTEIHTCIVYDGKSPNNVRTARIEGIDFIFAEFLQPGCQK